MSIWVLTAEANDYNQHGEYFIGAWNHKPSKEDLRKIANDLLNYNDEYLDYILRGGGRLDNTYDFWYLLTELKDV